MDPGTLTFWRQTIKQILSELAAIPYPEVVNLQKRTVFDDDTNTCRRAPEQKPAHLVRITCFGLSADRGFVRFGQPQGHGSPSSASAQKCSLR